MRPSLMHSDPVGDGEYFFQPVRDEDDSAVRGFQTRDDIEQPLDLAGLKDAVGSSKIIRLALSASALAISTSWRLRRGELPHFGFERQRLILTEFGQDLLGAAPHELVGEAPGPAESRQEDVFGDRQVAARGSFPA